MTQGRLDMREVTWTTVVWISRVALSRGGRGSHISVHLSSAYLEWNFASAETGYIEEDSRQEAGLLTLEKSSILSRAGIVATFTCWRERGGSCQNAWERGLSSWTEWTEHQRSSIADFPETHGQVPPMQLNVARD